MRAPRWQSLLHRPQALLLIGVKCSTKRGWFVGQRDRVLHDFFGERDEFEPVTPDELARRMTNGEVVVLDVRPEQEYAAGHIAGALSIPVTDLCDQLADLPRLEEYVAYCRGPYCVYADEAVAVLRANGLKAQRLTEGYPEWWLSGRPVRTST